MGFLKELFQKKLQDAASIESLEVAGRGRSEYSLPALRGGQHGSSREDEGGPSPAPAPPAASAAGALCAPSVEQSARSYSYVPVRKRQVEAAEQAAAAAAVPFAPAPQARIRYESISQFSQKVELYRGSISTVLKGVCIETGGKVIIKAYHKAKMHPKHFHKLQRELACMRVLKGAYVAELYSSFEDAACVYLVMEYCEGGDLFKTMLMHGGALEEQWVCAEVIAPLLRILEKMHALKLLHRDIKPENIFLTALGKFKLGDFGLAIKFDEEVPFSRSGTLDYMAPEVLKNPSVPFQEGRSVDPAMLAARGVSPYGPPVDVWAAGVLAYELITGHPPFEVEDEAQTAALIMYSDNVKFPAAKTPQWADFVRAALVKNPDGRPSAAQLLAHPWVQLNMQRASAGGHRPSKDLLLQPLPLAPGGASGAAAGGRTAGKRTASFGGSSSSSSAAAAAAAAAEQPAPAAAAAAAAAAAPKKLPPKLSVALPGAPQLPAHFPATPTAHAALAGSLHKERAPEARARGSVSATGAPLSPTAAASGSGARSESGMPAYGLHSPLPGAGGHHNRFSERAPAFGLASKSGGPPPPAAKRLSHLSVGHAGGPPPPPCHSLSPPPALAVSSAAHGSSGGVGALRPSLKVSLPASFDGGEHEGGHGGSADSLCYSPSTPAAKSGMKERVKFYFQRQAGGLGGAACAPPGAEVA